LARSRQWFGSLLNLGSRRILKQLHLGVVTMRQNRACILVVTGHESSGRSSHQHPEPRQGVDEERGAPRRGKTLRDCRSSWGTRNKGVEQEFPIATDVIGRTRPTRVLPQRSKMPVATDFRSLHNSKKPLRLADLAFDINED
jgi:hypothetical protein